MRRPLIIGITGNNHITHPRWLIAFGKIAREFQRFGIGNTDEHFMNFRIDLFQVEHDQIGMIEQIIQNRIIVQSIAIAVETGMNIVFPTGRKPIAYKLILQ